MKSLYRRMGQMIVLIVIFISLLGINILLYKNHIISKILYLPIVLFTLFFAIIPLITIDSKK